MAINNSGGILRKYLTRVLAAGALLAIYAVSTLAVSGVFLASTTTEAQAQRGRGRGRGRGADRGRGRGRGSRGRGRGRGYYRGGIWVPALCHNSWNSRRYTCL
jgi:hypothetical protein